MASNGIVPRGDGEFSPTKYLLLSGRNDCLVSLIDKTRRTNFGILSVASILATHRLVNVVILVAPGR
jgi:hypothetical protein